MPKLYSSRSILKTLQNNGFILTSQKGSHLKLLSVNNKRMVIVPANKKQIPAGTLSSILRQSGLSKVLILLKKRL